MGGNDHSLALFLGSQSCSAVEKANGKVHFVLWLALGTLGASYICLVFANLVDRYLVPLLRTLSLRLKLTDDLVGITFVGMASGLPSLAIHGYSAVRGSAIGIGSVFGGMIFNLTLGVGIVALVATHVVPLNAKYMLRDSLFYLMSFGFVLILFTYQMFVTWVEASIMVILYMAFIGVLVATRERKDSEKAIGDDTHSSDGAIEPPTGIANDTFGGDDDHDITEVDAEVQPLITPSIPSSSSSSSPINTNNNSGMVNDANTITVAPSPTQATSPATVAAPTPAAATGATCNAASTTTTTATTATGAISSPSRPFIKILVDLVSLPFDWLYYYTIPSCDAAHDHSHRWPATFAVTLIYSFALAYTLVNGVFYLICKLGIQTSLSGQLILSFGPALPDSIALALVARGGLGNMALSGLLGRSIFDLLLGLGLPWLLYVGVYGELHLPSYSLTIGSIVIGIAFLCNALGLLLNNWKLRPLLSILPISLYGVFVALSMMATQAD